MKAWALSLAALLLALVAAEWGARRALPASYPQFYATALAERGWEGGNWLNQTEPHPYFGYVLAHAGSSHPNNYGFGSAENFPYHRKPGEVVIGILGGSVAESWAKSVTGGGREEFLTELKKSAPALGNKKVVLLNFALGGYKQPQQFMVASYFAESVDLFVNLEGLNELRSFQNEPGLPMEYPAANILLYAKQRGALVASWRLAAAVALSNALIDFGASHAWAAESALHYAAAKGAYSWESSLAKAVADAAREGAVRDFHGEAPDFYSGQPGGPAAAVAVWERYALLEHRVMESLGRKAVFFLQPNQYLLGSKPLTDWEREHAVGSDILVRSKEYSLLPPAVRRLSAKGLRAFDLTQVFAGTKEQVYIDFCCHLNERGNHLLSAAIAEKLGVALR